MIAPRTVADWLHKLLTQEHLYPGDEGASFRLAPAPPPLPGELARLVPDLGEDLAAFQKALVTLYWQSEKDAQLAFARHYLDIGKNEAILAAGRLNRLKRALPVLIRPDVFLTDEGPKITEIDAVPGGFGLLAAFQQGYSDLGLVPQGGPFGVVHGLHAALAELSGLEQPEVAIAVSDESQDYRGEMAYLAKLLAAEGKHAVACHPKDLTFSEDGLSLEGQKIDVVYRFFELFDLKNVPKSELILYAARKGTVHLTPPAKAYLEEKMVFALMHHPALAAFFEHTLGSARSARIRRLFPQTWVVDPAPLPPQAVVHGLSAAGLPLQSFSALRDLPKAARSEWVLKPSGFSPLAWGARGLVVGADRSGEEWAEAVDQALSDFHSGTPWVLQRYHKPVVEDASYVDLETGETVAFRGRSRYCPYYFSAGGHCTPGGTLITTVPADKKAVHGMSVAVMTAAGELEQTG